MPLAVAEYLGQRTDVALPDIIPSELGGSLIPTCPFSGLPCRKLHGSLPQHPICSVRVYDREEDGRPFIVCSDRLIPAKANGLSPSHIAALASVTQLVFPGASNGDIGYKRQVGLSIEPHRLVLDYVLQVRPATHYTNGPSKVILEVQGGGETSSTGAITRHVAKWASLPHPTNEFLARRLTAEFLRTQTGQAKVNTPGIIPNNAWKRQLDQILKKATLTTHFGGAFVLVMGEILYDYVRRSIAIDRGYFPEWQIALLGVSEAPSTLPGPIPITQVSKAAFMTYADFITALQDFSIPPGTLNPFSGQFSTLRNTLFQA